MVDERPALLLAKVRDEKRRRRIAVMASAMEGGPVLRHPNNIWLLAALIALLWLWSCL